jgi:hypothetical protein
MRAYNSLETHRNRQRDLTGILERISKITSFGKDTGVSMEGDCNSVCAQRRSPRSDEDVIPI